MGLESIETWPNGAKRGSARRHLAAESRDRPAIGSSSLGRDGRESTYRLRPTVKRRGFTSRAPRVRRDGACKRGSRISSKRNAIARSLRAPTMCCDITIHIVRRRHIAITRRSCAAMMLDDDARRRCLMSMLDVSTWRSSRCSYIASAQQSVHHMSRCAVASMFSRASYARFSEGIAIRSCAQRCS